MDPTHKDKNKRHLKLTNPDIILPYAKPMSNKTPKPTKHPPPNCIDIHLQAKATAVSADFDASNFSLIKPNHQHPVKKTVEPKIVEKLETKTATAKQESSKDHKVKKLSLSSKDYLKQLDNNKKRVEDIVGGNEKKKEEVPSSPGVEVKKDNKAVKDHHHDLLEWAIDMSKRMRLIGRRRSLNGSLVELADFLASNGAKIVSEDLPLFMQIHAIDCARKSIDSLEKFTSKTLLTLKKVKIH